MHQVAERAGEEEEEGKKKKTHTHNNGQTLFIYGVVLGNGNFNALK